MARPLETAIERALARLMREISEASYCSAWEGDLEYALWRYVGSGRDPEGELSVTPTQHADLIELSRLCGGWIARDETQEFVALAEWRAHLRMRKANELEFKRLVEAEIARTTT
jgi:hypothetical protein